MAEGTRMKQMESRLEVIEAGMRQSHELVDERLETVEEGIRHTQEDVGRIRADVQEVQRNVREDIGRLREEFSGLSQQLGAALAMFSRQPNASLPTDFPPRVPAVPIIPGGRERQGREEQRELVAEPPLRPNGANPPNAPIPKLEIPVFEGEKPRWWVRRCERFFYYYRVLEENKVHLAAAYLNDVADSWFQNWSGRRNVWRWPEFVEELCARFGESSLTDVIDRFNKLKQEGTVDEYQAKFEELKSILSQAHPTLDEHYFVSSFLSGLNDELRPMVRMLQPTTVRNAAEKARLHELSLEAFVKKHKISQKNQGGGWHNPMGGGQRNNPQQMNRGGYVPRAPIQATPVRSLTIDQKRQMGLCFRCGEKYTQGHQCRKQLMHMEGEEEEGEEEAERDAKECEVEEEMNEGEEGGQISLHALEGHPSEKVIKIKGSVGRKKLIVLIDSGSTHSFLDDRTAKELECVLQPLYHCQ